MDKKCPFCGQILPEEVSFCLHCFHKINNAETTEALSVNSNPKAGQKKWLIFLIAFFLFGAITCTLIIKLDSTHNKPRLNSTVSEKQLNKESDFEYTKTDEGIIITSCNSTQKEITVPDTIDSIAVAGIKGNIFPENVEKITIKQNSNKYFLLDSDCFCGLSALKSVILPGNVKCEQLEQCFAECPSLEEIVIKNSILSYKTQNGVLINKKEIVLYPAAKTDESFTIPEDIKTIKEGAFHNSKITSLKFNKSSEFDCKWATLFNEMPNLSSIQVYPGSSADLIGAQFFEGEIVYYE